MEPFGDLWARRRRVTGRDRGPLPAGVPSLGRDDRCPRHRRPPGHVPWWPRPEVPSCSTSWSTCSPRRHRHAGHADILREQLDGSGGHRGGAHGPGRLRRRVLLGVPLDPHRTGRHGRRSRAGLMAPPGRRRAHRRSGLGWFFRNPDTGAIVCRQVAEPSAVGIPRCHRRPAGVPAGRHRRQVRRLDRGDDRDRRVGPPRDRRWIQPVPACARRGCPGGSARGPAVAVDRAVDSALTTRSRNEYVTHDDRDQSLRHSPCRLHPRDPESHLGGVHEPRAHAGVVRHRAPAHAVRAPRRGRGRDDPRRRRFVPFPRGRCSSSSTVRS